MHLVQSNKNLKHRRVCKEGRKPYLYTEGNSMEQLEADEEEEEKEGSTSLDVVTRCGDETDDTQHKTDAVWPRSLIRGVELSTMTTIA
jgi:hypothetical protein